MRNSFRSTIAILALIAGVLATAAGSARPASVQTGAQTGVQTGAKTGKSVQDPRVARILKNFQGGRKVLIQTSASEPVMKDFDQAEQLFAAGDLDGALTRLEAALKREARKATFRVIWSPYDRITEDYEKFDRCISFMQNLVNANPNVPDVRAALASAYGVKASNLQKTNPSAMKDVIRYGNLSVDQLDVALAIDPESFMARLARGITFSYEPARLADAEEDFDKLLSLQVLRKNPWYPYYIVYYFYGDALKRSNNLTRAREVLTLGLHYYPVNEDIKRLLDEVNKLVATR
jgi:tetratricopeptide (TPR) repeat protein